MKKAITRPLLLILLLILFSIAAGCQDEQLSTDDVPLDALQKEGVLQEIKTILAEFREALQDLLGTTPRVVHDQNLKTIDQAVDLFRLVEGKDPKGIGEAGEPGTLVGEGYLESNPQIPVGLKEEEGEWSEYKLKGKPLRAWPVGDWGGYRDGDTP
ncbi:MAG: hypothetical protein GXZ07_07225 [Firmicutes bacterium]|nr:hypothetical protein [Bacillota bacterium]